jgi:hypothetical protein
MASVIADAILALHNRMSSLGFSRNLSKLSNHFAFAVSYR